MRPSEVAVALTVTCSGCSVPIDVGSWGDRADDPGAPCFDAPWGQYVVLDYFYDPHGATRWSPPGCSGAPSELPALVAAAQMESATSLKLYLRRQGDVPFFDGLVRLYVGEGPYCHPTIAPPNRLVTAQPVAPGLEEQSIALTLDPTAVEWRVGQIKQFWMGLGDPGTPGFTGSSMVQLQRICMP